MRDPTNASTSKTLNDLPRNDSSRLIVVKIESASKTDASQAVEELQSKHGVKKFDVVVANAGAQWLATLDDTTVEDLEQHFQVNVAGVFILFKAVAPLLKKSENPKFVAMGSIAGSLAFMADHFPEDGPSTAYSSSKTMVHSLLQKIHCSSPWLTAFPMHPG